MRSLSVDATMPAPLDDDHLDLWLLHAPAPCDDHERTRGLAALSPEERARHDAINHPRARDEHLRARRMVRHVLSRYAEVAPDAWRFAPNAHGRPFVTAPSLARPLHFNLSHTRGMLALTVARSADVGCDVEWHPRRGDTVAIAHRYFAPAELEALRALPTDRQRPRFFTLWTLKEAYIKARALGLAIPLQRFAFDVGDDEAPRGVAFAPGFDDDAARWWFARHDPTPEHTLSVAWGVGGTAPRVRTHHLDLAALDQGNA
ncbi:MAG: 4'-phosphopantetheinyl transferase superfamily protein [Polyangiales bacterium]